MLKCLDSLKNGVFVASSTSSKTMLGIFALIFVFFVITISFAFVTFKSVDDGSSLLDTGLSKASIGVVTVEGPIMTSRDIIELLQKAEKDKSLKGIILKVNSPGGAVGPTQEIYEEIVRIDKEVKPIITSMESMAASGGYYLASGTRKIYANAGTLTGSIGVIMQFMDISKLYEFAKVQPKIIKAGKYKDIGSEARAMTPEEEELMNATIASVHEQFKNDILAKRPKLKDSINELAQGQIYTGEMAKKVGLIDEVGGLYKAARDLHKELGIKEEFAVKFIEKKKRASVFDLISTANEAISKLNVQSLLNSGSEVPQLYFK